MRRRDLALPLLTVLGTAILALIAAQYVLYLRSTQGIGADELFRRFVAIWAVEGALYLAAVWISRGAMPPGTLGVVLVFTVVMRLMPLAAPPFLSSDVYRYVWDGRVQDAGLNPYCCIPSSPELERLQEPAIYPNINRSDYAPTIYPPAAQMLFAAVAWISQTIFAMKLAMALCDGISCLCLLTLLGRAGLPRHRVLIFAWNPLVIWEFVGSGHVDAATTAWLALALVAATSRRTWVRLCGAGIALAGATLTKFLPIVVTPAFWRRDPRLPFVFAATVAAAYACYASVGWRVLGFLGGYTQEEGLSAGSGVYWLRLLAHAVALPSWSGGAWLGLTAVLLAVIALVVTLRAPRTNSPQTMSAAALVLAAALIVTLTPHYAWYFGWLAFLACLAPFPSVLWLTVACVVLYLDAVHDHIGWESVLYLPFVALAIRDIIRARASRPA